MSWGSFSAFVAMGGAAPFVWGSYGVSALLIVVELWLLSRRRRDTVRRLRRLQQLED